MSDFNRLLRLLASDRSELQSFLLDTETWLSSHRSELGDSELEELRRVAKDMHGLSEYACAASFEDGPEARFGAQNRMNRRRMMIKGCSATLAGVFSLFFAKFARAQAPQAGGSPGLLATDANCPDQKPCADRGCENTTCLDSDHCLDEDCTNSVCHDSDSCIDSLCDNRDCVDSLCSDLVECTNHSCRDTSCMDIGDPAKCSNASTCTDTMNCIDDGCSNHQYCYDETGCIDGTCHDHSQNGCIDDETCPS